MMSCRYKISRAALIAMTWIALPAFADPPEIRNNPFSRPDSEVAVGLTGQNTTERASGLVVTAAMVSDSGARVHVDGRVLRPGEQIHGYTLLRVFEDRAIFEKGGRTETVFVKPQLEQNDEDPAKVRRPD